MFNNNVTQTYNFQDASYEIIFMLLGAFLLGSLLTWLLNKLFDRDYSVENSEYRYDDLGHDEIHAFKETQSNQAQTTSEVRIVDKPTQQQPKIITPPDDLTKISGIDSKMQSALSNYSIKSYADLRDIKTQDLKSIQNTQNVQKREVETWPHQASLAAKGEWNKLKDYQGFIQRVQVASTTEESKLTTKQLAKDELTKIVGISPEIEGILNNKEIHTFTQLSHMDSDILKSHLSNANSKLTEQETESWPHQAAMADKQQWDELKVYQDFMHSDNVPNTSKKETSSITAPESSETKNKPSKVTKLRASNVKMETNPDATDESMDDHDNLKKIEGIGPKIEEILNGGGIYTYSQLYNSNRERLRKLLKDAGNQFRMHNPDSWPHQAGMANRSEWDELNTYQQSLIQEQATKAKESTKDTKAGANKSVSKLSSVSKKDDLRKIEGIGPKIEELLNNAGINTFEALSNNSRDAIKKLLNEAGPQFRMHEPESWSHQAKLAAKGDWKALEEYQDFLNGGRE